MKAVLMYAIVAAAVLSAGVVQASPELSKSAGCVKCHDIEKKKKGPPFKESAAKYKGKAGADATIFKAITDPKGDHPEMKASADDTKTMIKWILTL
ncbi:MAG: class I cytochrome c [Rubrivivax sp.]|nr:class I cytochrome c [Rubrivivax sp.]